MKYLNSLVFLSLMVFVAGCQKKEQPKPKKDGHKVAAKVAHVKKDGPTKLETKKSAHAKVEPKKAVAKKVEPKKAQDVKKAQPKKVEDKKHVVKKDDKKSKDKAKN